MRNTVNNSMNHCGTRRLETERLVLRRFVTEDAEAVLKDWTATYASQNYYQWAIVLKENGECPIGSISAVGLNDDLSIVHIGYCLGRPWWHRGIMSEALKAVIDFFFYEVGANRIESRHDPRNPHSGMVMQKCGMKYEGTLRCSDRNNQGICDACWYAILKSER